MTTRREIIKTAATGTIAYVGGSLLLRLGGGGSTEPYKIETENADFYLFHGFHGEKKQPSQAIQKPKSDINFDAFFLETGAYPYMLPDGSITMSGLKDTAFYKDVIPYLETNNIPILLGDIPISKARYVTEFLAQNAIESAAVLAGAKMSFPIKIDEGAHANKLSRRDLLRVVGGAVGLWGATGLMKYPAIADDRLYRQPWAEGIRNALGFTEFMHPEDFLVGFRNALITEKLLYYTEQLGNNRDEKPTIGIAIGASHALISQYLKEGRNYAIGFINRYPDIVLRGALGDTYKEFLPTLIEINGQAGNKVAKKIIDPELVRNSNKIEGNRPSSELKG